MEMEFFCRPEEADEWYEYWQKERYQWYLDMGIDPERLRMREHENDELAHYAKGCGDVEYLFPFGWSELEGIANRTDYDLRQHSECSGQALTWFDQEAGSGQIACNFGFVDILVPTGGKKGQLISLIRE